MEETKPISHLYLPPQKVPKYAELFKAINDKVAMRPKFVNYFVDHFNFFNTTLWANATKVAVPVNGTTDPVAGAAGQLLWDTTTGASTFSEVYFATNKRPFTLTKKLWMAFRIYSVGDLAAQTLQLGLLGNSGFSALLRINGATNLDLNLRCQGGSATASATSVDTTINHVNATWVDYALFIDPTEHGIVHVLKWNTSTLVWDDVFQSIPGFVDVTTTTVFYTPYFICSNGSADQSQGSIDYIEIINEV